MQDIQQEIRRLEQDLNNALEMSNRAITDRFVIGNEFSLVHFRKLRRIRVREVILSCGECMEIQKNTKKNHHHNILGMLTLFL